MKYRSLGAKVIVEFKLLNVIDRQCLDEEFGGSMKKCILNMVQDEHIIGMAEDKYKVLSVETI